ncbi:TorF family putative porin [Erythrobacter litoralis]|uniref:Porin domain-containing protein n=1 Tax=Erythrobacter litoralis (strain HTCC2594) TaxID=314225 RepID=Q2NDA4_ERYLH|nr:TorF family putative porin [Erythrobacter litoralis]ABC62337.1 hypothetical protein ELI_01225 [Erythrobacter litoralis HTCC2594]
MLTSSRGLAATFLAGTAFVATPVFATETNETVAGSEARPVAQTIEIEAIDALIGDGQADAPADAFSVEADALERVIAPVDKPSKAGGDSGVEFSANVALTTEYRFRGVDLSGGELAIQGGFDVTLPAGFYVGTWASSLDETTVGYGSTELDVYGGWSGDVTDGVALDVGVIGYLYPDAGPGDFDYVEFYGSVAFTFGPAETTLGVAYAPDQDSLGSTDNLYLYTDVGIGIPNTPITINGHLGYTDGFLTFTNDGKAWDWSIGAEVAIPDTPLSVSAAYVGAEGDIPAGFYDFVDDAFVVTVSASF